MEVVRKPFQIILIEHIFYPLLALIAVTLFGKYGGVALGMYSGVNVETASEFIAYSMLGLLLIIFSYFLIYGSVRLWFSAKKYSEGWKRKFYQGYGGTVFVLAVYGFISSGIELISIINNM